jgi:hypothetical protein
MKLACDAGATLMSEPTIAELQAAMSAAIEAEAFERAAELRAEIVRRGGEVLGSKIRRQVPGAMGLGSDQQVYAPPKGWKPPPRPEPLTSNQGRRGGRRRTP